MYIWLGEADENESLTMVTDSKLLPCVVQKTSYAPFTEGNNNQYGHQESSFLRLHRIIIYCLKSPAANSFWSLRSWSTNIQLQRDIKPFTETPSKISNHITAPNFPPLIAGAWWGWGGVLSASGGRQGAAGHRPWRDGRKDTEALRKKKKKKTSCDPDRCWKRTDQEESAAGMNEAPNFRTRVLCATGDMFTKGRRPTVTRNDKVATYSWATHDGGGPRQNPYLHDKVRRPKGVPRTSVFQENSSAAAL